MRLYLTELDVLAALSRVAVPKSFHVYREVERMWEVRVRDGGMPPTAYVIANRLQTMADKGWLTRSDKREGNSGFTWQFTEAGHSALAAAQAAA
ncbi:hypothetical protein BRAO375_3660041 [Bradyrhizobium sp. ORS 375]|uniref:hypothetical protein n=1 Tax=Bradyrhizobium sp. (strain ORS 375) TaxID=566679 RepID=UPI0002406989|nr:hypothetical protein [Bradyrhizobium sp. ORS 375]CCD94647.1 hypothetical protein BRAO375_3660041 [Bradyrhizobium sp. ORS 375]